MNRRNREALCLFKSADVVDDEGYIRINSSLWAKIDLGLTDDWFTMQDRKLFEIEIPTQADIILIMEKMDFILEFYRLTDDDVWQYLLEHHLRKTWSIFDEYELSFNEIVFVVKRIEV